MEISDDLVARVSEAPLVAGLEACQIATLRVSANALSRNADLLLEVTLFLFAAGDAGLLTYVANRPNVENGKVSPGEALNFIAAVQREIEAIIAKEKAIELQRLLEMRFAKGMKSDFGYEFTDGDLRDAQSLIDDLRKFIQSSPDLGDDHRRRLLKRLEEVQSELHKNMSSLDRAYCLAIEASIVAGKIGENAKPLVGAAKALFQLLWRTHAHKEGLPSASRPSLGSDTEPLGLD